MATEQYSIGYEEGFQNGWNAAVDSLPAQRKPLTDDEMDNCLRRAGVIATLEALRCIGREVEAAHGIKENT